MSAYATEMAESLRAEFGEDFAVSVSRVGEVVAEVPASRLVDTCMVLRDDPGFRFEQLIDACGVDYLAYGRDEWVTFESTVTGFSRGVARIDEAAWSDTGAPGELPRYAVVYHLLSVEKNRRLRIRTWCEEGEMPIVPSVTGIWPAADWFEREAFDLFGILFDGHPDLRRILTDYGFVGHPFRKDFPLIGNVEVRYDPERQRVIYQPVTIEPRTLVPKVIREDNRYEVDRSGRDA